MRRTLLLIAGIIAVATMRQYSVHAQSDPATLPLVMPENVEYLGSFKLSPDSWNGKWFSFGGKALAFRAGTTGAGSLFISSRTSGNEDIVAEVGIPTLVKSSNLTDLNVAAVLQPFYDPTEGHLGDLSPDPGSIPGLSSLLVYDGKLYGTARIYYDAGNTQRKSHYSRSLQLNQASFSGWSSVGAPEKTGFVASMLALVPSEWQSTLGALAVTGQCCVPVESRTSLGPASFGFDPGQIIAGASVSATDYLWYDGGHATLGPWDGSNARYGATTLMGGVALINGTRTALFLGTNGIGEHCYGNGTSNPALAGTPDPDGHPYCYDPTNSDKGSHAYPYEYRMWAYDLNDFVQVKAGVKQPWNVEPYKVWTFANYLIPTTEKLLGGVAFDPDNRIIYVAQLKAETSGAPVIHAFRVNTTTGGGGGGGATVSFGADKPAPQLVNTTTTFTASATAGTAPYQYEFSVFDGTSWTSNGWTNSNTFAWTPTTAGQGYRIRVGARSSGNSGAAEATSEMPFAVSTTSNTTHVGITPDRSAPQPAGTTVTFTASPVGGIGAHQYQWLVHDGWTWNRIGTWTTSNTFTWTPATSSAQYRIGVWVKSAGNSADAGETTNSMDYPIQ